MLFCLVAHLVLVTVAHHHGRTRRVPTSTATTFEASRAGRLERPARNKLRYVLHVVLLAAELRDRDPNNLDTSRFVC